MNTAPRLSTPPRSLIQATLDGVDFAVGQAADAGELVGLFHRYFDEEAGYKSRGIVFDPGKARERMGRAIDLGLYPHIIARTKGYTGEIVGVVSYSLDSTFCVEPVAVLDMLYVVPAYRRTALGRILVTLVVDMARGDGAVAFHAPLAAEGRAKVVANLFKHAGFEEIGVIVGRKL